MYRLLLLALLPLGMLSAQPSAPLSLGDALRIADERAYANRIASAEAAWQRAAAIAPLRGILPGVRVEMGALATTDPINAFGVTLRQRAITAADFNPATLNYPDAARTRSAGLVLEQPLFNADAWTGRRAASAAADATDAMALWTRTGTRVDVVRAYYGATLAAERRETLIDANRAASAHVSRAQALADTGLVTRSDALLASVRAGEIAAEQLEAAADAEHAQRSLAVLLGIPSLSASVPTTLPSADAIRRAAAGDSFSATVQARADVTAAEAARAAAHSDALRAKSLYLPRVNSFARYDWNDATGFFANKRSWTVGVMATWSPFAGASEIGELRASSARAAAADARVEAATANAELERQRTADRVSLALTLLEIAERAVAQSVEAHRIVARKYDGGLATISELLEAAAIETETRLRESMSRYHLILATAERRVALGADPATLASLDTVPTDR